MSSMPPQSFTTAPSSDPRDDHKPNELVDMEAFWRAEGTWWTLEAWAARSGVTLITWIFLWQSREQIGTGWTALLAVLAFFMPWVVLVMLVWFYRSSIFPTLETGSFLRGV